MSVPTPNISWLFYKDYFEEIINSSMPVDLAKIDFTEKNKNIFQQNISKHQTGLAKISLPNNAFTFELKTAYPGLMSGTGINHSIKNKTEIKLGFSFDHTTGLPIIPGSSVKGLLRSFFSGQLAEAAQSKKDQKHKEILQNKSDNLKQLMQKFLLPSIGLKENEIEKLDINLLEKNIFEGYQYDEKEPLDVYHRDIFFDAFPIKSLASQSKFIGEGAITPHGKNPLKEPIPIKFLKILPEVSFQFQFRLHDCTINEVTISAMQKNELFRLILKNFGIGAKTNVGFGKLREE